MDTGGARFVLAVDGVGPQLEEFAADVVGPQSQEFRR
jgi:hypothetical protein